MDQLLLLLLLLWGSGLQEGHSSKDSGVRLVGGDSRCAGTLEVKHQGEWRPVWGYNSFRTLEEAQVACRDLNCGSAVSVGESTDFSETLVWRINVDCVQSGSSLRECAEAYSSIYTLNLTCSDSVRLLDGTSLCSGRLEVKSDESNPSWFSVCEADFDQQDAEVVCRDLDCGAPSVLQGVPYGEKEGPMSTKEFQCGGHESALLNCSSDLPVFQPNISPVLLPLDRRLFRRPSSGERFQMIRRAPPSSLSGCSIQPS
ncbi:scavenger receptor cysteine-rich type 1 protein M130-like [Notothenia coriiceps]|uniref:Scavenger receptor cysteine-rich type 1 protein M130-like n=1 Tax=Notothenia coriiceps TaxID=8208 RepID=A0A6I9PCW0_9TELE|nr:PREDICTED: scavenger receptor cysteine-rich type 1 protein M130-like [Notothenia coriiceps]